MTPSTRAQILTRRTYNRPLNDEGSEFESWLQTVTRVIDHQRWLWERAQGSTLVKEQNEELAELKQLMLSRKVLTSGRTLWLGGTDIAKKREASMFNCAFSLFGTVNDVVDQIWLLMQGCGKGFNGNYGILNGFSNPIEDVEVIRSTRTEKSGIDHNEETWDSVTRTWTIKVGDSAEAWSKAFGKLLAGKYPARKLVLDFSAIRPAGTRLKGYGWISSGDEAIALAMRSIAEILSRRAGQLLTRIDLLDIGNWLGTVLSSRRSAEIALHTFGDPEWEEFAMAKRNYWDGNMQRGQSNNSLVFYEKPTKLELRGLFEMMLEAGGSEPGFINGAAARERAPWFKGVNPCAEILLGDGSFCNLVETNLAAFNGDFKGLQRAHYLIARANYRQTCVNLRDGILQDVWHEQNEFLRLCGVGVTGIVRWEYHDDSAAWRTLRNFAHDGVDSMAEELGLPYSKAVTTVKPSGTLSKIMDTTEGVHKPLGRYIFNNVNFGKHDPLIPLLRAANYRVFENPNDPEGVLVTFPVKWDDIEFETFTKEDKDGNEITIEVNTESAIEQLERYKMLMENYVDHNCSITISYDPSEVPAIVDWLDRNWDVYVGVSWLIRTDPTKSAADLGYLYLPQEVVTQEAYEQYVSQLLPVDIEEGNSHDMIDAEECVGGVCPVR